jgi:hypothetical protein
MCVQGGEAHVDIPIRKQCLVALHRIMERLAPEPSFEEFAVQNIGVRCCLRGLCNGSVDIRDGGALGLLNEASQTICALHAAYSAAFEAASQAYVEREEGAKHRKAWGELLVAVAAHDVVATKANYKALLRAKQARAPRAHAAGTLQGQTS